MYVEFKDKNTHGFSNYYREMLRILLNVVAKNNTKYMSHSIKMELFETTRYPGKWYVFDEDMNIFSNWFIVCGVYH